MGNHVFVSYSHNDHEYVARLKVHLTAHGLEVWTDEGIDYGSHWPDVIERQIETCAAFIPVMSDQSREAAWVKREIILAQSIGKVTMPLLLSGRRFLQLIDIQDEEVTGGRMPSDRFVTALKALVRQGGTGTSVPPTAPVAAVEWSPTGDRTTPSGAPYYYVSSLDRLLSISEQHRILVAVDSAELGSILGYSGHTNAQRRFENTIAEPMLAIARPYRVVIGWANVREIRKNSADWRRLLPKTGVGLFAGRERSAWREFRGLQAYAPFDEVLGPACRELLAA